MEVDMKEETSGSERSLFGGALTCYLPNDAQDVSVFRDVPDNQEVFCHKSTDQSIMIDILEYQTHVVGQHAARYHFDDLATTNDAGSDYSITAVESMSKDDVSFTECSEAWHLTGHQNVSKFNEKNSAKNLVDVHMMLYRLPQYETDIIIIINSAVIINEKSSSNEKGLCVTSSDAWQSCTFKKILSSLKLIDSSIFGG